MKSWKTTAAAVIGFVVLLLNAATQILDEDPATNPDYGAIGTAGAALVGLLFARDNDVSSEKAGAS